MHIAELAPRMRPARRQLDMAGDGEPFEVGVSIDLEDALEPRQIRRRTFRALIRAVEVDSGWRDDASIPAGTDALVMDALSGARCGADSKRDRICGVGNVQLDLSDAAACRTALRGDIDVEIADRLALEVDRPQQRVGGNMRLDRELVEQSSLVDLPKSHHDLQSCFSQRLNQRISSRATA